MRLISAAAALAATVAFAGQAAAADLPLMTAAPCGARRGALRLAISGFGIWISDLDRRAGWAIGRSPTEQPKPTFPSARCWSISKAYSPAMRWRGTRISTSASTACGRRSAARPFQACSPDPLRDRPRRSPRIWASSRPTAGYRLPLGSPDFSLYATVGGRYQGHLGQFSVCAATSSDSRVNARWLHGLGRSADRSGDALPHQRQIFSRWTADIGGFSGGIENHDPGPVDASAITGRQSISTSARLSRSSTPITCSPTSHGGSFRYNTTLYGPYIAASYNF